MNGLGKDAELGPLIGAEVVQLSIGSFQCQLAFDKDVSISIESACIWTGVDQSSIRIAEFPPHATQLCKMLGATIRSTQIDESGGLLIHFSDATTLHLLNETRSYESFQIYIGRTILVA